MYNAAIFFYLALVLTSCNIEVYQTRAKDSTDVIDSSASVSPQTEAHVDLPETT